MNVERKREIEIFNAALAIESTPERKQYLDQVCTGDPERRQRIEALLEAYEQADSLFASEPRTTSSTELKPLTEGPGTKIGPYKLLQEIGEGGMGVVYMAQQDAPIQRKVALKIIKVGMDTRQVVARFEAERQALAMMNHPNIAQVFDAGCTQSGRPYFVMELVQGVPITEFCDRNKLSTKERIRLFIPVCQAIQSAHQKGIIHRDIKPSNILVTMHHGEPLAKVIDFGVAKATNQKLTEKTLFTNFGSMIGTPAYMSPEQAEMSSMDVDTRTDVYSLGVLLYELLTGTTPFDQKELLSKGYGEMQRVIAEQEPEKPSLRMSTLGADKRTAVAKSRGLEPPALQQMLKGDLDCIAMKCLEKDRRRRYDTPNELVADLKRHLDHEPVSAAPPTFGYQCKKIYGRNRALVHAVAAISLTLIAATVVSVAMAVRMSQLGRAAIQSEKKALSQAAIAEAVNKFLNEDLLKQAEAWNEPDPDIKLRTVVDRAAQAVETKLKDQPLVEAAIRLTLSEIFRSLDDQAKAKYHSDRARELYERELGTKHPDTLKAKVAVLRSLIEEGNKDKAKTEEACKTASDLLNTCRSILGKEHETTLAAMRELVEALGNASRYRDQEPILKEAIALHEKVIGENDTRTLLLLGSLAWNRVTHSSQIEQAVELAREVVKRSEKLSPDHPFRYSAKNSLAATLSWLDQGGLYQAERRELAQKNLEFARRVYGPNHWKTIDALATRASAGRNLQEMIEFSSEGHQLALNHWGPKHLRTLQVQKHLAFALGHTPNRRAEAEELFLSGIDILKTNFGRGEELLREYLLQMGDFFLRENPEKAESYFKETAEIALETQGEQSLHYERALARLAGLYSRRSEWRAKGIEINWKVLQLRKDKLGIRNSRTAEVISVLAQNVAEAGRPTEADDSIREAADAFAQSPPQSNEEWNSLRTLLKAIRYSASKEKFLHGLRGMVSNPPKNVQALTAVAEFHRVAGDLIATHKAYQALSEEFPDAHLHWEERSTAAIGVGEIKDHLVCSRELLTRWGNEENSWGRLSCVLGTFFLVPDRWTSDELARVQHAYDHLNQLVDKQAQPQIVQVANRAVLALADYRLKRFADALEQLNKAPFSDADWPSARGQALAVAALCHAALGHRDKALEALGASSKAVEKVSSADQAELSRWRYLFSEATQLIQGKKPGEPSVVPTPD